MAQYATTAGSNDSFTLIGAGTTNATLVKAGSGLLKSIQASNINAAVRYLKVYDKATAPTVGTDVPILTLALPQGAGAVPFIMPDLNIGFQRGLGIALTTGVAITDVAAVAANEQVVNLSFR